MRKYGKWVLTLGLLAATPGLTLAAGSKSNADERPAAGASKEENQKVANDIAKAMRAKKVSGDISIEYKNGVATLSGTVADSKVKERAQEAVSKVPGVKQVDNRLTHAPSPRDLAARRAEPAGGVVSANHTASAAKSNRVQQVNAETVAPPSGNQEVAEQIAAALTAAKLNGYDIQIRYQNGVAMLEGSVGTQSERAAASQVVSQIPGVRSVANRLSCTQEPAVAQRPPYAGQPNGAQPYGGQPYGGQPYGAQPYGAPGQPTFAPAGFRQDAAMPPAPGGPQAAMPMAPPGYGHPGMGASQAVYNNPNLPDNSWPSYAQYPNSAMVNYPTQYSASAWPYIGPFYPYPQVPLGWRDATLRWDDGQWNLMFRTRTDKWWWYMNPNNW